MRIGLLGGTFNPPHLGHLVCAQEAWLQLGLDRLLLIPAGVPPHKPVESEPGPEHRLELCRLAVGQDERFEVSDLEVRRSGPSYTVDTLQELHNQMPDSELYVVVGADVAAGFSGWREAERILSLATVAVAERNGTSRADVERDFSGLGSDIEPGCRFFDMPHIGISSTMLRRRIARGEPTQYLMPHAVRAYIDRHGLYSEGAQA